MPPLKNIDRGINGDLLNALEETGLGDHVVVVDASYAIPRGAHKVDYQGDSTPSALAGILKLVPTEDGENVILMSSDPGMDSSSVSGELEDAVTTEGLEAEHVHRMGDSVAPGFYAIANAPEKPTLFVRTRDERAFACAMFVVGHSQIAE